ncbi:MAG: rod shape-determining protein MreC [Leadbetterella sp.]
MSQLFGILYSIRHFFLFGVLQVICFYLLSKNSVFWEVTTFNTTNSMVAGSLKTNQEIHEFINLNKTNEQLVQENKILKAQLAQKIEAESLVGTGYKVDSTKARRFDFLVAKVISSSVNLVDNYITIDKGTKDGIRPQMGVICPQGVVGQVLKCSDNYSLVVTLLNSKSKVSAEITNKTLQKDGTKALGVGEWEGVNPSIIAMKNVDMYKPIRKGDSVYTSFQNPVFPPKIPVGRVSKLTPNKTTAFFDMNVKLATDFTSLIYVYVVTNKQQEQETQLLQEKLSEQ